MSNRSEVQVCFVTVVYDGELPLLELQARSIERFIPMSIIEEIIILVNDVNEEQVIHKLNSVYLDYYGTLKHKVKVISSEQVFSHRKPGLFNAFLDFWAKKPHYRFRKKRGGWFANNGWAMQQAFKLCSARVASASHIIMLDTKNVFIQQQSIDAFVDANGKARTNFIPLERLHKRWLPPSFKALQIKYNESFLSQTTQFTTPFVIERSVLTDFLQTFERYHDSVQGVFARRFIKPTEFMLINIFCKQHFGELNKVFAEGLVKAKSFYTSSSEAHVDTILTEAENGEIPVLGLHITVMGRLTLQQLERLKMLLVDRGILDKDFDIVAMREVLANKNVARIKLSQHKLPQRIKANSTQ